MIEWFAASLEEELRLSALSLGEIRKGIGRVSDGKRKQRLNRDYGMLRSRFATRILPITDIVEP